MGEAVRSNATGLGATRTGISAAFATATAPGSAVRALWREDEQSLGQTEPFSFVATPVAEEKKQARVEGARMAAVADEAVVSRNPEATVNRNPEVTFDGNPEATSAVTAEMKPEVELEVEPEVEAEVKPEVKTEVKPEAEPGARSEAEPDVEMEIEFEEEAECGTAKKDDDIDPETGMTWKQEYEYRRCLAEEKASMLDCERRMRLEEIEKKEREEREAVERKEREAAERKEREAAERKEREDAERMRCMQDHPFTLSVWKNLCSSEGHEDHESHGSAERGSEETSSVPKFPEGNEAVEETIEETIEEKKRREKEVSLLDKRLAEMRKHWQEISIDVWPGERKKAGPREAFVWFNPSTRRDMQAIKAAMISVLGEEKVPMQLRDLLDSFQEPFVTGSGRASFGRMLEELYDDDETVEWGPVVEEYQRLRAERAVVSTAE